jgi:hypothetical protein
LNANCTPTPTTPPCAPTFYCDTTLTPEICQPRLNAGDDCNPAQQQCYGLCSLAFGRSICDSTPPPGGLVCDGSEVSQ